MNAETKIKKIFSELTFHSGQMMQNRVMLAPLTNMQSNADGSLSDDEFKWLTMRAAGGYGITITCAAHVQKLGQGFQGQLGIFADRHYNGLKRLAEGVTYHKSLGIVQLHHAGMRSPSNLICQLPVAPSNHYDQDQSLLATKLSEDDIKIIISDFVKAAQRAEIAGFNGVEIHGAHGYLLTQFLSSKYNSRTDSYGGSLKNRSKLTFEILKAIRENTSNNFIVGLRLSPDGYGLCPQEMLTLSQSVINTGQLDFLDISFWDVFRQAPHLGEENKQPSCLFIDCYAELDWKNTKLLVSGKIKSADDIIWCLDKGADFVALGKTAILHHDFPNQLRKDIDFLPVGTPVSRDYLRNEGLGETFINYMESRWEGFVN